MATYHEPHESEFPPPHGLTDLSCPLLLRNPVFFNPLPCIGIQGISGGSDNYIRLPSFCNPLCPQPDFSYKLKHSNSPFYPVSFIGNGPNLVVMDSVYYLFLPVSCHLWIFLPQMGIICSNNIYPVSVPNPLLGHIIGTKFHSHIHRTSIMVN